MRVLSEEEQVKKFKLDKKDKQILGYLCDNIRLPLSRIAKLVGLSRNSVEYRVKQMQGAHLIAGSRTVINVRQLGYYSYHVFVQIHNTKDEKELIEKCKRNKAVNALIGYCGKWDYEISIMAKDPIEFNQILEEIIGKTRRYTITTIVSTLKSSVLPGIEQKASIKGIRNDPSFQKEFNQKEKSEEIDEKDMKILHKISDEADIKLNDLAKKTGLSSDATAYRLRKLIKQKYIVQFRPVIDYSVIGLTVQCMLVKGKMPEMKAVLQGDESVLWCAETVGNWDYIIYVMTKTPEEFNTFTKKLKEKYDENLESYELLFAYKDYKYTFMSKNIKAQ